MELTECYLHEQFAIFNKRYFGGVLPEPRMAVSHSRTRMGQFVYLPHPHVSDVSAQAPCYCIRVSDYYDMPFVEYQRTLLHEMIHYYIAFTHAHDTSPHGPLFRQHMKRLNADGWNVTISYNPRQWPLRYQREAVTTLLLLVETTKGEHFVSAVNPGYAAELGLAVATSPAVLRYHWARTTDFSYAQYPRVRSLRGHKVSKEEYEHILATCEVMS